MTDLPLLGEGERNFTLWLEQQSRPVPSARVFNSAPQALANGGFISLTFDSESWDTANMHDPVQPARLTARVPGLYALATNVEFGPPVIPNTARILCFSLNGNPGGFANGKALYREDSNAAGVTSNPGLYTEWRMVAGDWFEVIVLQASGAAINATASPNLTWFSMTRLSA